MGHVPRREMMPLDDRARSESPRIESSSVQPGGTGLETGWRSEIVALRAVAVALVVAYHFWPDLVPGGFIGVDVFFVVSGYLICGHLFRELSASGAIRLWRFWSRRIVRLLPASLTVLAFVSAVSWQLTPMFQWRDLASQLAGSALYVQNFVLSFQTVDYMNRDNLPTAVQHFWSLAVEEQLYVVTPLILIAVWAVGAKFAANKVTALVIALSVMFAISFFVSVVQSGAQESLAYFSPLVRGWEFFAGAFLAIAAPMHFLRKLLRKATLADFLRTVGWLLLAAGVLLVPLGAPFPGAIAAIPVLGTVLIIFAGASSAGFISRLYLAGPTHFLGDISYSLYLWHWPVLTLMVAMIPNGGLSRVLALVAGVVLSLVLAYLTRRFVEIPFIDSARARSRVPLFIGLAAMTSFVLIVSFGQTARLENQLASERSELVALQATEPECFGAAAAFDPACGLDESVSPIYPIELAQSDSGSVWSTADRAGGGCEENLTASLVREYRCTFGAPSPSEYIALVGDSHAAQWASVFADYAESQGLGLIVLHRPSCPVLSSSELPGKGDGTRLGGECQQWAEATIKEVTNDPRISTVVTSMWAESYVKDVSAIADDPSAVLASAYAKVLETWQDAGKHVVVLEDTPYPRVNVPGCLASHHSAGECSFKRSGASPSIAERAVNVTQGQSLSYLDLTTAFCDEERCRVVTGGVISFRDNSHITATFARTLLPWILPALEVRNHRD